MRLQDSRVKKLTRSKQLIRRLTVKKTKKVFFTDEKLFYVSPLLNSQNDRVGLLVKSAMSIRNVFSCNELSFQLAAWCQPECVTEAREVFISSQRRLRLMPTTTLTICCLN